LKTRNSFTKERRNGGKKGKEKTINTNSPTPTLSSAPYLSLLYFSPTFNLVSYSLTSPPISDQQQSSFGLYSKSSLRLGGAGFKPLLGVS
jgi:hypothetical protein